MVADRDQSLKSGSRDGQPRRCSISAIWGREDKQEAAEDAEKGHDEMVGGSEHQRGFTHAIPSSWSKPPFHPLRVVPPWPPVFHLTSFGSTVTASGTTPGPRGAERCVVCCPIDYTMSLLGDMLARFAGSVEIRGKPGIGSNHIHHSRLRAARNVRRRVGNIGCS